MNVATRRHSEQPRDNLIMERSLICRSCEHKRAINGRTVSCAFCGCTSLSFAEGRCAANKWPPNLEADLQDAAMLGSEARNLNYQKQNLLLQCQLSPGDVVMLTAAVRDLHRAYPNKFVTWVDTTGMELWDHNPYVARLDGTADVVREIPMHYPLINQSNQRPVHFLQGYTEYLEQQLGLRIPVTEFRGDIHLSEEEKNWKNQVEEQFGFRGPFWILMAGGKYDFTAKWWPPEYYQEVVNKLQSKVQFVQCGEENHWHPPLKGVFNLIGKTSLRQFVRLMYHAQGVVCPVTFAMHLAAAVPSKTGRLRPCVVIAGGREPPHWEAYPGHQFLHTIGMLPCCANGGCWKSRCQKVGDGDEKDRANLCERPIPVRDDLTVPQCMAMIEPRRVVEAIDGYVRYSDPEMRK